MAVLRTGIEVRVHRAYERGGLRNLSATVRGNAGRLAYNYSQRVVSYIQHNAPIRTGHLRQSTTRKRLGPYKHEITVGAYYGVYVNYGTRYMHAQPFWEPALAYAKVLYDRDKRSLFK
jgi:HK97 gp10 family phage protein